MSDLRRNFPVINNNIRLITQISRYEVDTNIIINNIINCIAIKYFKFQHTSIYWLVNYP